MRLLTIKLINQIKLVVILKGRQPRSQGLSSYRLGRARRDLGLFCSLATVTIENIREGSSVIRQFVALSFVALSRHRHHTRCLKSSLRPEILNSVYSDFYLKVRQVFLEKINRGCDAVVVVSVGFMDSHELWTSSRPCAEQFYSEVIVINRCFSFKRAIRLIQTNVQFLEVKLR